MVHQSIDEENPTLVDACRANEHVSISSSQCSKHPNKFQLAFVENRLRTAWTYEDEDPECFKVSWLRDFLSMSSEVTGPRHPCVMSSNCWDRFQLHPTPRYLSKRWAHVRCNVFLDFFCRISSQETRNDDISYRPIIPPPISSTKSQPVPPCTNLFFVQPYLGIQKHIHSGPWLCSEMMLPCILGLGCNFVEAPFVWAGFWFCNGSRVQTHFVENTGCWFVLLVLRRCGSPYKIRIPL